MPQFRLPNPRCLVLAWLIIVCLLTVSTASADEKTFSVPGKSFKVAVNIPNYGGRGGYGKEEPGRVMAGKDKKNDYLVEIYSEDIRANITPSECQDYYKRNIQTPDRDTIRLDKSGKYPLTTFFVETMMMQRFHQRHVNGYFARDNVCFEVHVSKMNYREEDEAPMRAILDSVHFLP